MRWAPGLGSVGTGPDGRITNDPRAAQAGRAAMSSAPDAGPRDPLRDARQPSALLELTQQANRYNVSFYPFDTRGLTALDTDLSTHDDRIRAYPGEWFNATSGSRPRAGRWTSAPCDSAETCQSTRCGCSPRTPTASRWSTPTISTPGAPRVVENSPRTTCSGTSRPTNSLTASGARSGPGEAPRVRYARARDTAHYAPKTCSWRHPRPRRPLPEVQATPQPRRKSASIATALSSVSGIRGRDSRGAAALRTSSMPLRARRRAPGVSG